jgi:D-glutamate cyclase
MSISVMRFPPAVPPDYLRILSSLFTMTAEMKNVLDRLQSIVGSDAGNRGMKSLIVPGDLQRAAELLATPVDSSIQPDASSSGRPAPTIHRRRRRSDNNEVVILSGFPCCVDQNPPTETDGPPGTYALVRACAALQYQRITVVTDACNEAVFRAAHNFALKSLRVDSGAYGKMEYSEGSCSAPVVDLLAISSTPTAEQLRSLKDLLDRSYIILSCERAGPGPDGNCYTMRGINMTERGLIGPIHNVLFADQNCDECSVVKPWLISIGDGGNELGMGKVIDETRNNPKIHNGQLIGCVIAADCLIAASVSNWGAYALAAGAAYVRAAHIHLDHQKLHTSEGCGSLAMETPLSWSDRIAFWVQQCVPTKDDERNLLDECVAAGCRDGVSGKLEATVDGMPLETSLKCLDDVVYTVLDVTAMPQPPHC